MQQLQQQTKKKKKKRPDRDERRNPSLSSCVMKTSNKYIQLKARKMKGGIPSLIHIHKSLDSRRALILAALPSSSVIGCAGGRIRQAAWNFSALFSFPPPPPTRPAAGPSCSYISASCMYANVMNNFSPLWDNTIYGGPTHYIQQHT